MDLNDDFIINNIDILKYLIIDNKKNINFEKIFIFALDNLYLEEAKFFYDIGNIDSKPIDSTIYDNIFIKAIKCEKLDIAKYILSLNYEPKIEILNNLCKNICAFCPSILYGFHHYWYKKIVVINFLCSINNTIIIECKDNLLFENSCRYGCVDILKALNLSQYNPTIEILNKEFKNVMCDDYGKLEVAKYLYYLNNNLDIRQNNDEIFKKCDYNKKIWLLTICDYNDNDLDSNVLIIKLFNEKQYIKLAKYLKIQENDFKLNSGNNCSICFSENYNFLSSCNHSFCLECFLLWYIGHDKKTCSYCMKLIDIEKCYYKN
jgi:hypothetical protein